MTIDFNKILARQDYVKMTKLLREKCDLVEDVISKKMVELELDGRNGGITVNHMRIFCIKGYLFVYARDCGPIPEYEQIMSENNDVADVFDEDHDRNFIFSPCCNKSALRFLNNAVAVIEELGKIEQEKIKAIESALELTKGI